MSSKYLTPSDRKILENTNLYLFYIKKSIDLQFPPKVTSDSRKIDWKTISVFGSNPSHSYTGNSAREMSLKIEYVVEDDNDFTSVWSVRRIKQNINNLKGIFTGFAGLGAAIAGGGNQGQAGNSFLQGNEDGGNLLITFTMPLITGFVRKPFIVRSVNVEYSDEMVLVQTSLADSQSDSVQGFVQYPLKSTVTMSIATYNINYEEPKEKDKFSFATWEQIAVQPLPEDLWY